MKEILISILIGIISLVVGGIFIAFPMAIAYWADNANWNYLYIIHGLFIAYLIGRSTFESQDLDIP